MREKVTIAKKANQYKTKVKNELAADKHSNNKIVTQQDDE